MRRTLRALNQHSNPYGNPKTLNFNHWAAEGIHTAPVNQKRVLAGTVLIVGVSFVVFKALGLMTRDEKPGTLNKEWQAAQAKRHRERQMAPISTHKIGKPVTVFEPSIVEGED